MRPSSLLTSREIVLAALVLALLGLTGSTSGRSVDTVSPATAPTPPPAAVATPEPRPRPAKPSSASSRPVIPMVDATAPRPDRVDERTLPARLRSGDLDLDLPIRPVGVTDQGEMEIPKTVNEVGWYRFGPAPGSKAGSTVLAAHVDTKAEGLGPFVRLNDARRGDRVTIVDRSGRPHTYQVAEAVSLDRQKIDWETVFDRRGPTRLVLVTCGGAYDQGSGYRDNVLVTAFPLS